MADLGVETIADDEPIVESHLTKWSRILQLQIVKAVKCAFRDALKASYCESSNGLKTVIFKMIEQALCEVVRSCCDPTVSEDKM